MQYPVTEKTDQVDDYHGVKVADPYRWLEDADSRRDAAWVEAAEQDHVRLPRGDPAARADPAQRLDRAVGLRAVGMPCKEGGRYFFSRNNGLQNQRVLYVAAALDGEPRRAARPQHAVEGRHRRARRARRQRGRQAARLRPRRAPAPTGRSGGCATSPTGKDLPDVIKWVKFSGASWTKDGKGFFYSRYPEPDRRRRRSRPNVYQKLYYHSSARRRTKDLLVYERPDQTEWRFGGRVTEDGQYLVITAQQDRAAEPRLLHRPTRTRSSRRRPAPVVKLIDNFDAEYDLHRQRRPVFYFKTDHDAPRGRVIAIDMTQPGPGRTGRRSSPRPRHARATCDSSATTSSARYLKDAAQPRQAVRPRRQAVRAWSCPASAPPPASAASASDTETFYALHVASPRRPRSTATT